MRGESHSKARDSEKRTLLLHQSDIPWRLEIGESFCEANKPIKSRRQREVKFTFAPGLILQSEFGIWWWWWWGVSGTRTLLLHQPHAPLGKDLLFGRLGTPRGLRLTDMQDRTTKWTLLLHQPGVW